MYKSLSEINLMTSNNTRKAIKRNKFAAARQNFLDNKKAENLIIGENYIEHEENRVKDSIENFRNSNGFNKRRYLSEKMNFKNRLKQELFNEFVSDLVLDSLVIEEVEKRQLTENVKLFTENVIKEYMEVNNLNYDNIGRISPILEDVVNLCENTSKQASDDAYENEKTYNKGKVKILNELDKDKDLQQYEDYKLDDEKSMKQETKEAFDDEKERAISSLRDEIKEKVIDTIHQEKERAKALDMEKQDIEDSVSAIEKYGSDEEELNFTISDNAAEGQDNTPSVDEDEVDTKEVKPTSASKGSATVSESGVLSHISVTRNRKKPVLSIYGTFMNEYGKQLFLSESANMNNVSLDIDMGTVMLNSLISQTLLESMHILGFTKSLKERRDLANIIIKSNK